MNNLDIRCCVFGMDARRETRAMVIPLPSFATPQTPEYTATLRAGAVLGALRRCEEACDTLPWSGRLREQSSRALPANGRLRRKRVSARPVVNDTTARLAPWPAPKTAPAYVQVIH